jgi:hypothetical protein
MSFTEIVHPVLETDSRLTSTPSYFASVKSTPQSIAQNVYPSNSQSNSNSHLWNLQTPSVDVVINRNFIVEADIKLRLNFPGATAGPFNDASARFIQFHGRNNGLCSFPLNRLCNTMTLTMNNLSTTVNSNEVLTELSHMYSEEDLLAMSGTANCPDYLALYNGIRLIESVTQGPPQPEYQFTHTGFLDNSNVPNILGNYFNSSIKGKLKGNSTNVQIVSITPVDNSNTLVDVVFRVRENLIGLSPLTSGADAYNHTRGMMGVTNIQLQMVFGDANRLYRSARHQEGTTFVGECSNSTLLSVENARLFITYYSLKPSQLPNPRNAIPYYQINRYYSNETEDIAGASQSTIQSPNIQLSVIPDVVLLTVEPLQYSGQETSTQQQSKWAGDWAATIENVALQFNNQNGILSNASKYDLWNMSKCSFPLQEWHDFNGSVPYVEYLQNVDGNGEVRDNGLGDFTFVRGLYPMAHCHLALRFGTDIPIPQEFLSVGSLGAFNFSAQVKFKNQITNPNATTEYPWKEVGAKFRLKLTFITKGAIVNELGSSSLLTGFFSKEMVMSVIGSEHHGVSSKQLQSFIGRGKMDMEGAGIFDWIVDNTVGRIPVVGGIGSKIAKSLNPFGGGISGGGISGGAQHMLDKYKL